MNRDYTRSEPTRAGFVFCLFFNYAATESTVEKISIKKVFVLTRAHLDC